MEPTIYEQIYLSGKSFHQTDEKIQQKLLAGRDMANICFGDLRISIYDVMMTYAYKSMVLTNYFMELTILVLKGSVAFTFSGRFTQGLFCFLIF